jgi:hypothetical protein
MKLKKSATTFSMILLGLGATFAQQSVNASGGNATGSGGTVSYSVGQIDYKSNNGTNGSSSEGVQQPFEFYTVGIFEAFTSFEVNLFPNPSSSFINLSIANWTTDQTISFQLCDLNGKVLSSDVVKEPTTIIDVQQLADANYFLNVLVNGEFARTFKLIKTN